MQIALRWDDEHAIGLDVQSLANERDRHLRVAGEDFVKESGRGSQVIDDDDRNGEIGRQIPQSAYVCVESSGGATDANQRKVMIHFHPFLASQKIPTFCQELRVPSIHTASTRRLHFGLVARQVRLIAYPVQMSNAHVRIGSFDRSKQTGSFRPYPAAARLST